GGISVFSRSGDGTWQQRAAWYGDGGVLSSPPPTWRVRLATDDADRVFACSFRPPAQLFVWQTEGPPAEIPTLDPTWSVGLGLLILVAGLRALTGSKQRSQH